MDADVIVVGAGWAGLVAAGELAERGKTVLVVERERGARSQQMKADRVHSRSNIN
ncbi:FAD-dependent oxidoreductase [Mycobacterium antarcticum]|uniref:FAD-dependent oxidoreductase n=1 Tax=unclassified Mycolicibacterium TaxID=2636767 RepID=UPI0024E18D6C|nr:MULTISPECIES: FAD-dependent oxidoreductase [unclassified Mycolicibacterium]